MHYVYVLKSKVDGYLYIGCTDNLKKRVIEHNAGKTKSIKHLAPFVIMYYEAYINKTDARKRKIELKKNSYQKEQLIKRIENCLKK